MGQIYSNRENQKADITSFLKIIQRYKEFDELTPTMLFELIDKIVVFKSIAPYTKYKRQRIDIYFRFIGCLNSQEQENVPSEKDYLAMVAQWQETDRIARAKRKNAKRYEKERELRRKAREGDPDALIAIQPLRESERKRRERQKAKRKREPQSEAVKAERRKTQIAKAMATKRQKCGGQFKVDIFRAAEQGDPDAIERAKAIKAEDYQRHRAALKKRLEENPEYAAAYKEKLRKLHRIGNEKHQQKIASIRALAEAGDAESIAYMKEFRRKNCERQKAYYERHKKKAMEKVLPNHTTEEIETT